MVSPTLIDNNWHLLVGVYDGTDEHLYLDGRSVGGAPLSTNWDDRLLSGDRTPGFQVARVLKDLRLGAAAYDGVDSSAPIFAAALAAFERAAANGHALDDMTTVVLR